jgi:hypothetical protein
LAVGENTFRELATREDRRGFWSAAWGVVTLIFVGLAGHFWSEAAPKNSTIWPFTFAVVFSLGSLVGLYLVFAPLLHLWPHHPVKVELPVNINLDEIQEPEPSMVITIPGHTSYAVFRLEDKPYLPHMVLLTVICYAASQRDSDPITILSARANIQLDDGPLTESQVMVGQHVPEGGPPPPNLRYPPVVDPGETIEIDFTFHVTAAKTDDFPGTYLSPRNAMAFDVVLVDQLQREYFAGDVRFPFVITQKTD